MTTAGAIGRGVLCAGLLLGVVACAHEELAAAAETGKSVRQVLFREAEVGREPAGFHLAQTGGGASGTWVVQEVDPPGTRVLAQTSTDDTSARFPLCILDGPALRDGSASVRFQAVSGEVDRAAGLVVRYTDPDHYYLVRANALEDNVRLYRVVGGRREQFAGAELDVSAGAWHSLRLDFHDRRFTVTYDDRLLFSAEDDALPGPGAVGLWTKADSVTWFDDLRVEPADAGDPAR